jgi:hypothetical protein
LTGQMCKCSSTQRALNNSCQGPPQFLPNSMTLHPTSTNCTSCHADGSVGGQYPAVST